jgi:quinol-cytochrome oxidoreductase complex cytochrome b subunit
VTRTMVTAVALLFIAAMAFGTVYVLIEEGPDVLTLTGLLVVAVLSLGVFGALTEPSPKRKRDKR